MNKTLICIVCPRGCRITVNDTCGFAVKGNACKRGKDYAMQELTHPLRTVTGLVRVKNRCDVMLSVKTEDKVPKEKIFDVIGASESISVDAPICIGDIIIQDSFGTTVVATKSIK